MLDRLLACKNLTDLTIIGLDILSNSGYAELESDILGKQLMFAKEEMLGIDVLQRASRSESALRSLLSTVATEEESTRVLHMLQILKQCCPAVSMVVTRLLRKTTC